jgi:hypothetical protein
MYPREEGPARAVLKPEDSSHLPEMNRQDAEVAKRARMD